MLKVEETLRLSQAYISECSRVKDEVNGWLRVTGELQELVASHFGFNDEISNLFAVNLMRSAHHKYSDDSRFSEVSVYVRNNLAKQGSLKIGDDSVELNIHDLNGKTVSLSSITDNKDTVIISSSAT